MDNKKTILIIEDEPALLTALSEKLSKEGFIAIGSRNGEGGLEKATAQKPDIVLLDIVLPKMDGITVLKELRKNKLTENIPVIMLTNLSDGERIGEAIEQGSYEYLIKSDWKIEDVVEKIKKRLR